MNAAFAELPARAFPFLVEFFKVTDREGAHPVHAVNVSGPGALKVPPLAGDGVKVWVRTTFADGTVGNYWPD